ncbi:HEAT repeat domain-containing protein [Nostoc sp. CHAB 5784]|uniref:HEAT repeat domain-containing protein n=1 Tax=Nostoc mirabile TaxID=2907820 RepID=UPI001E4E18BE|nr:HEAT repeat domain-containing protein [Nostoc mirabile]MCC5667696.1 HEAT repeat domain-containing protein [Nostoc mirabile CHAB5784]
MLTIPRYTSKRSLFFLFCFTLLLTLFLSLPWVNAEKKPKPQAWQINGIVAALKDPIPEVRATATQNLQEYQLDNPKTQIKNYDELVKQFVKQLQDKDSAVSRNAAAQALGQMQAKEQAPQVAQLLKDSDTDVRKTAAYVLEQMQAKEQAPQVAQLLKDSDTYVRNAAAKALGQMQAKEVVPQVVLLLKDYDSRVRNAAVEALGQMQAKEQAPQVAQLLKDSDTDVRRAAAYALGQMQAKEQAPQLAQLLKNPDGGVRGAAIQALGQMQAKEVVPQLVQLLKNPDDNPRYAAIRVLGQMQAKEVVPQLAQLLEDSKAYIREVAAEALGQMQAKEKAPLVAQLLKKDREAYVRKAAAVALGQMQAKEQIPQLVLLLKQDPDSSVRKAAAEALGQMQAKEQIPQLVLLLKQDPDSGVRKAAAEALIKLERQDLPVVVQVLDSVHSYPSEVGQIRFVAHFLGGGKPQVEILMQWVGRPKMRPEKPTHDQGVEVMEVFKETWKHCDSLPELQRELAEQISKVAAKKKIIWKAQDINLLQTHYSNLKKINSTHADALQSVIKNVEYLQWFLNAKITIISHAAFWLALIFAYPKFPQVQAIFFWNPWVRRILGVGYVGFLLTWVPFLRRKLFEPFKPSLLADAGLDNFHDQSYFPESKVKVPTSGDIQPITAALPSIQGQIILEGDSGLGKSMFLRHLLKNSQRIVVYLPAQKCHKGVIEAIQDKLHGQAQDAGFLKNLIYSGAIDICIDGLNEVTADTRAKICQFVESYFRGNIIMTTQPLEWTPPSTAKTYYLQPLEQQQIQEFLISRQPRLPKHAKVQGADYAKACTNYLTEVLKQQQAQEELDAVRRILSNPMDLTVVALMLSQGKHPNLFRLQEQQYNLMAAEYLQEWNQDFPLKRFSAAVYQMRLEDKQALPGDEFHQVVKSLEDEKYKMVVSRQWQDEKGEAKKEWYFRHDKIMDFFLVQNFLGETDAAEGLLVDRMGDPRFRGVYFLLATLLPLDAAKELREDLIQYAADTKDNTVSNTFVQLLRTR